MFQGHFFSSRLELASFPMGFNNILSFFLFQKSTMFIAKGTSSLDSRSSYFKIQENKQLIGFVVEKSYSPTLLSCSRQSLSNLWCTSINFKFSLKTDDEIEGNCELNKHDFSVVNENIYFNDRDGVIFSFLLRVINVLLHSLVKSVILNFYLSLTEFKPVI